jgi:hypothetical protein
VQISNVKHFHSCFAGSELPDTSESLLLAVLVQSNLSTKPVSLSIFLFVMNKDRALIFIFLKNTMMYEICH